MMPSMLVEPLIWNQDHSKTEGIQAIRCNHKWQELPRQWMLLLKSGGAGRMHLEIAKPAGMHHKLNAVQHPQ